MADLSFSAPVFRNSAVLCNNLNGLSRSKTRTCMEKISPKIHARCYLRRYTQCIAMRLWRSVLQCHGCSALQCVVNREYRSCKSLQGQHTPTRPTCLFKSLCNPAIQCLRFRGDISLERLQPYRILCSECVTVCCNALQCVAMCFGVLQCVAVCCSVLQCVALCCSVLRLYLSRESLQLHHLFC